MKSLCPSILQRKVSLVQRLGSVMKIMLINTFYYPNVFGGAEKSVQILAEGLADLGHEVVVVSSAERDEIKYFDKIKAYYVYHHNVYWGGMPRRSNRVKTMLWHILDIFNPAIYKALTKIIRLENPDIIHTNMLSGFSSAPWIIAKKLNKPVVHTLREYNLLCLRMSMFHKDHNCTQRCFSCRWATASKKYLTNHNYVTFVAGLSNYIINCHRDLNYFIKTPYIRIFNGLRNTEEKVFVPRKAGTPIKILYLGRIDKPKGVLAVLEAVKNMDGIELHLGGRVMDDEITDGIVHKLYPDHIKFLGFVEPEQIIEGFDLIIVPSLWHEPFGRVVIEAYQHGKPVIASNRGGLPEIILEGQTGFLFDPDNPTDLPVLLQKLIHSPECLTKIQENIRIQLSCFKNESVVREYETIYDNVVNKCN